MKTSEVCAHCSRVVDFAEGIVDDMRWYHTRCYYSKLKNRSEALGKKAKNGSLTIDEYGELKDISNILQNIKKELTKPILEMSQVFQQSTPIFEGPSDGMRLLKEHTKILQDRIEVKQLK